MKQIVEYFREKNIIFPSFVLVDNKAVNVKSKIKIYKAIDLKNNYCSIIHITRKSRFLQKDSIKIQEILEVLKRHFNHNFAKQFILIQAPLCSKAKKFLEENKWKVFVCILCDIGNSTYHFFYKNQELKFDVDQNPSLQKKR